MLLNHSGYAPLPCRPNVVQQMTDARLKRINQAACYNNDARIDGLQRLEGNKCLHKDSGFTNGLRAKSC